MSSTKKYITFTSTWISIFDWDPSNITVTVELQWPRNDQFTAPWEPGEYRASFAHDSTPRSLSCHHKLFIRLAYEHIERFRSLRLSDWSARQIIHLPSWFRHGRFTWLHPTMLAIQCISDWTIESISEIIPLVRCSEVTTWCNIARLVNFILKGRKNSPFSIASIGIKVHPTTITSVNAGAGNW